MLQCVDSDMAFKETKKGEKQNCTSTKLDCDASHMVRSHCKDKCNVSYCCEDTKAPFFEVNLGDGKFRVMKSCNKAKKYCGNNPEVRSACPVTCKECILFSIGDLLHVINGLEEKVKNQARGHRFGIYEYVFVPEKMSWEDHNTAAKEWGGHIASIHSSEEELFVWKLGKESNDWVWIDGVRIDDNDTFNNTVGTPFDYVNWKDTEPNNMNGDESNIVMGNKDRYSNKWVDYPPSVPFAGVYKKEFMTR